MGEAGGGDRIASQRLGMYPSLVHSFLSFLWATPEAVALRLPTRQPCLVVGCDPVGRGWARRRCGTRRSPLPGCVRRPRCLASALPRVCRHHGHHRGRVPCASWLPTSPRAARHRWRRRARYRSWVVDANEAERPRPLGYESKRRRCLSTTLMYPFDEVWLVRRETPDLPKERKDRSRRRGVRKNGRFCRQRRQREHFSAYLCGILH